MPSSHPRPRSTRPVRPPDAPPPGPGFIRALEDPNVWRSNDGQLWRIGDMSTDHLWNLLGYCRYFAPTLIGLAGLPVTTDPYAYLAERPVLRAVAAELAARDEAGDITTAFAILRAGGRVPWEGAARGSSRGPDDPAGRGG